MRLSSFQRAEILAKLNRGVSGNQLAEEYNVARSTISRLKKRKYNEIDNSEVAQPDDIWNYKQRRSDMNANYSDDPLNDASNENDNDYHNDDDDDDEVSDGTDRKSTTSLSSESIESESERSEGSESESDSSISESCDEDEEDPNEICEELRCIWHPNRSFRVMIQLIAKLRRGGYIE